MKPTQWFTLALLPLIAACGALEPKYYPESQTITSTLFPSHREEKADPELEAKVKALLEGRQSDGQIRPGDIQTRSGQAPKSLIRNKGKLLIINNLTGVDTEYFSKLQGEILKQDSNIEAVEMIAVSSLPNLSTLRLMGARQQAQYVLIFNSFSNAYVYHNSWTIPTLFGAGLPYFFLETQNIRVFAKIEYSLIDIKENIILSNESVTTEGAGQATLPESGIVEYQVKNQAIASGVERLGKKFMVRLHQKD